MGCLYMGFIIRLPRQLDTKESYYGVNGKIDRLAVEVKFYANSFSCYYRHLNDDQNSALRAANLEVPDVQLTQIRFELSQNEQCKIRSAPFPFVSASAEEERVYNILEGLGKMRFFDLIIVSHVDSNLRDISEAFGQRGYTKPLYQWYWRDRPRYVKVFSRK